MVAMISTTMEHFLESTSQTDSEPLAQECNHKIFSLANISDYDSGDLDVRDQRLKNRISRKQECLSQRRFNLYRYYLNQYPELFQEISQPNLNQISENLEDNYLNPPKTREFLSFPNVSETNPIEAVGFDSIDCLEHRKKLRRKSSTSSKCCCQCTRCLLLNRNEKNQSKQSIDDSIYSNKNLLIADQNNEYLLRILTPPNDFLSSSNFNPNLHSRELERKNSGKKSKSKTKSMKPTDEKDSVEETEEDFLQYDIVTGNLVWRADKRTQTNKPKYTEDEKSIRRLCRNLQQRLSLIQIPSIDEKNHSESITKATTKSSIDLDHRKQSITSNQSDATRWNDRTRCNNFFQSQSDQSNLTNVENFDSNQIEDNFNNQLYQQNQRRQYILDNMDSSYPLPENVIDREHRIKQSKNELPCQCAKCLDRRGKEKKNSFILDPRQYKVMFHSLIIDSLLFFCSSFCLCPMPNKE
ncbi:hypothetical protein NH340_JMT00200 [Sarcoptes scabiei]|nr:hypothetical protein NH340_JMT00200 [Sarcoptes scabiei]